MILHFFKTSATDLDYVFELLSRDVSNRVGGQMETDPRQRHGEVSTCPHKYCLFFSHDDNFSIHDHSTVHRRTMSI